MIYFLNNWIEFLGKGLLTRWEEIKIKDFISYNYDYENNYVYN